MKHLFGEYRYWIERKRPFDTVEKELADLARQGESFRRLLAPKPDDAVGPLATFMERFDVRTAYPLLLFLADQIGSREEWASIARTLESYLLRRSVMGWSSQAYNRVFMNLLRFVEKEGCSAGNLRRGLSETSGETAAWPTDEEFHRAWRTQHVYQVLNNAKIVHLLRRLNDSYWTTKSEVLCLTGALTVEHLMPQNWTPNWPLPDGSPGLSRSELATAGADDPRAAASRRRSAAIQTIGNLTILTQELNSAASNAAWDAKRAEILASSALPINRRLQEYPLWDEAAIERRAEELFAKALEIWPGPGAA